MPQRPIIPGPQPELPANLPAGASLQAVLDLQRAFYQGEIPREAALASAGLVCGFSPAEAEKLFPPAVPLAPRRSAGVIVAAVIGAIVGTVAGGLFGERVFGRTSPWPELRQWEELALFLGLVGGALLGGLLGPLVRTGMAKVWQRHLESP
jgi:hypothetical protein